MPAETSHADLDGHFLPRVRLGGMSALAGGEEARLKAVLGNEFRAKAVQRKGRDLIVTFHFGCLGGRRTGRS